MEIGKKQRDPKKSLSRQVVDSIEEMIMERKLGPGDVLPTEIQISEELQVSKSSVREAIKMLEALGVVEIRRGLCTVISKNPEQGYMNVMLSHFYLNSGNEEDLQNFRYIIESAYTTYAIHQATDMTLRPFVKSWSCSAKSCGTARWRRRTISCSTGRSCRQRIIPL